MFVLNICKSISINVELPVTVRMENVGAISMSNNVTTTSGTKHVDIRTKFLKDYQENGKIKTIFVRMEENDSDIMTKTWGHCSTLSILMSLSSKNGLGLYWREVGRN